MNLKIFGAALVAAALSASATGAELKFNEQATRALLSRCKNEASSPSTKECLKYLKGMADGYCLGISTRQDQAKNCMNDQYRDLKESTLAIMEAEKGKRNGAPSPE